jgi:hypothetical protein
MACRVGVSKKTPPLHFVLSTYDLNGTWLGVKNWTLQMQACGADVKEADIWSKWVAAARGGG